MADITNTTPRVKEYVDYAQRQIDEQAILDKYNAAIIAQFNAQREQNRIAENKFYNQMYNTQRTAMDTIRKANASAVTTGASRGVQAANELSALLGLEQESVASATELAQANRQTAQEETAAVLENVLNAYQQANQERSQLVTQAIEAASLDAAEETARAQTKEYTRNLHVSDPELYYQEQAAQNNAANVENMSDEQFNINMTNATTALEEIAGKINYQAWDDSFGRIPAKTETIRTDIQNLYKAYGLSIEQANKDVDQLIEDTKLAMGKYKQDANQFAKEYVKRLFSAQYNAKRNNGGEGNTEVAAPFTPKQPSDPVKYRLGHGR